jgi:hypothetical protein
MPSFKWICKHHQLKTGDWVPEVHLYEEAAGAIEVVRLLAPEGRQFPTEGEAITYCEMMVQKWIKDS